MKTPRLWLLGVLLVAFGLRVWGLDFGLPYDFHADEHYYVEPVLNWFATGQADAGLTPSLFGRMPFKYTLLAGYGLWFALSPGAPTEQGLAAVWFFARFWSVIFGVLTVALTYPLGKRLYGPRGGLLAAVLMAGLFLPVRESHFAVNDAAGTFWVLLALYLSVRLLWRRRWFDFLGAGVAVAVAAATKLTGWSTVVAFAAAYGLTFVHWGELSGAADDRSINRRRELLYLGGTALAVLGTLGLISVRSAAGLPEFAARLLSLAQTLPTLRTGAFKGIQMAPNNGWQYYFDVLGWGTGWLLVGAMVWAIGAVCWRRYRPGLVLVVFCGVYFAYMGGRSFLFARFILPIVPPLVILAAGELSRLPVQQFMRPHYRPAFWAGVAILLLAQPLVTTLWFDHLLTLPDTRQQATDWLLKQFPANTVLVKESYSVFPQPVFAEKRWPAKEIQLNERGPARNDVDYYVAHKTDLIVTSNFVAGRARQDSAAEVARLAQQALLNQQAELIKTFSPYRNEETGNRWFYLDEIYSPAGETLQRSWPGPLIKIYRLPYQNQPFNLEAPPMSTPVQANFGNQMVLLGYDLPVRRARPGGAIPLTLYWQALVQMGRNYLIFDHLLDSEQRNWGGYDRWPQETSKTTLWRPGEVVADTFSIPVSDDAPDGVYSIDIGLYPQDDPAGTSLPLVQDGVLVDQNSIRLGPVKIGGPPPELVSTAEPQTAVSVVFGEQIQLLGFDGPMTNDQLPIINEQLSMNNEQTTNSTNSTNPPNSPNSVNLKLFWQTVRPPDADYTLFVHVRDSVGNVATQKDQPLTGGVYPSSLWDVGERLLDSVTVPLPENLPPGRYSVVVGLYNLDTGQRLTVPGSEDNSLQLLEFEGK